MRPEERLARFDRALELLVAESRMAPIIVEGARDVAALRTLGVPGEIIPYNRGRSMTALADELRDRDRVIVLFDWDRKGGQLTRLLIQQVGVASQLDLAIRKEFAVVSLVRCVEDLPAARRHLLERSQPRSQRG